MMKIKMSVFIIISVLFLGAVFYDKMFPSSMDRVKSAVDIKKIETVKGDLVPSYSFTDLSGIKHDIADMSEKITLLHFWASWCLPCKIEFPQLLDLARKYDGKIGIILVSIDDDKKKMDKFITELKHQNKNTEQPYIYWVWDKDKDISLNTFNAIKVPETIFINQDKIMVHKTVGETDWGSKEISNLIDSLL